jgi:large conductance mechanosensitive channel
MLRRLTAFLFTGQFLARASLFQLAAGLVVIYSLQRLLTALLVDFVFPIIAAFTGGLNFENSFLAISRAVTATNLIDAKKQGAVLAYGDFLTDLINFVVILLFVSLIFGAEIAKAPSSAAEVNQHHD